MKALLSLFVFTFSIHVNGQFNQLDGLVTESEWDKATIIEDDISKIRVIDMGDYLWIRLKSEELYVASLCLCGNENEVIVLHASAALGAVTYQKQNTDWSTEDSFIWKVRETDMNESTIRKRKEHYEAYGWVANTVSMGEKGETEFIINKQLYGNGELYLAAGLMPASDPENIIPLPTETSGDCADPKLVGGPPNSKYQFNPKDWYKVN